MHVIAAKAIAFGEALTDKFMHYIVQVKKNANAMSKAFLDLGYNLISNGTDNHMMLIDLRNKNITGKVAEEVLGKANITVNKNAVPNDPRSPFVTSGLRIGSPAITRRGFKEEECIQLVDWMSNILTDINDEAAIERVKKEVLALCANFPVYGVDR